MLTEARYPNGFSVDFKAPNGRYLQDKQVAEAIVGQLAKVGIKAELETTEWSTYVQGIVGRKYELFLLSQGGVQIGPAAQTNWSSRIKGIAWQGYENPKVDELIKVVLRGEAVPMSSPSPKGVSGGFVESLRPYLYDSQRAKSLLREAGFPNGFTVNFKAPHGRYLYD